jgi:hypothetical protein
VEGDDALGFEVCAAGRRSVELGIGSEDNFEAKTAQGAHQQHSPATITPNCVRATAERC